MAERLDVRLRQTGMTKALVAVPLAALLLAGCGDTTGVSGTPDPGAPKDSCTAAAAPAQPPIASVDLDGDGVAEPVSYSPSDGKCKAILSAEVRGRDVFVDVNDDLPVTPGDGRALDLPGRTGQILLVTSHHPRGGFQARIFGYADGKLEELTVDGRPVLPFVATDTVSTPMSATCGDGGFVVTEARAHRPMGIVPAWDVERTTYAVDGNTVTRGATTEVADNVLDKQLHRKYRSLVRYQLFANCLATG